MKTSTFSSAILLASGILCASAQTSSAPASSTPSTTTAPAAATTSPAANAATNTTANPTGTTPATAPFAPVPITQPVTTPVVPPTATPVQGNPVTLPLTAPGVVTQPPGQQLAPGTMLNNGQFNVSGGSIDALAAAGVSASVDPQNALANLRRATVAGQQGVIAELQTRLDATNRALTEARANARAGGMSISDSEFDRAAAEVRVREDVLRDTLRNLTRATSEQEWQQLQSLLGSQYSAYADAVLRANRYLTPTQ